jgi:hypothetical protein
MVFKNYCGVFFSPIDELTFILSKLSEEPPRVMKGKGISICTFNSVLDVTTLSEYFRTYNFNFLVFDLSKKSSGFNFIDKQKEFDLFGFLSEGIKSKYEDLANTLMDDIISGTSVDNQFESNINVNYIYTPQPNITEELDNRFNEIENMTKNERNTILNQIIDKGIENLNDSDKKILEKISKLL